MHAHLAGHEDVETVYNLLTQQLGLEVMVAIKAKMRANGSALALVAAINRVEQSFRAAFPEVKWLFFEPDVAD